LTFGAAETLFDNTSVQALHGRKFPLGGLSRVI
jgi:hypothetical protein